MRRPTWVVMTYAVLLLLAVATALPNFLPSTVRSALHTWATSQTGPLGLDLQGGAHLLLNREDLAGTRLQDLRDTLAAATAQPGSFPDFTADLSDDILRLSLPTAGLDRAATMAADSILEVNRHRVDQVGVSEPIISRVGADRILMQMPGVENPAQLRELRGSTAMSFQMVARGPELGVSLLQMDNTAEVPVHEFELEHEPEGKPAAEPTRTGSSQS